VEAILMSPIILNFRDKQGGRNNKENTQLNATMTVY
jgi:hypothetical protein